MPKSLSLVFIILFIACKQNEPAGKKLTKPIHTGQKASNDKATPAPKIIDTILDITKEVVDGRQFTIQRSIQVGLLVFDSKNNIVFRDSSYIADTKFKDFNNDGYKDVWITHAENVPGIRGVLLYDKAAKTFKEVVGFDAFPAPQAIAGTKYYYSYHRSGCADMDWTSDLFYIDNYRPVKIGTINGYNCADSGIKDGLYIYKTRGEKKTLVRSLPIKIIDRYEGYKWGYIKAYWYKNYKLFS